MDTPARWLAHEPFACITLEDDLAFCASCFDIGHGLVGRFDGNIRSMTGCMIPESGGQVVTGKARPLSAGRNR